MEKKSQQIEEEEEKALDELTDTFANQQASLITEITSKYNLELAKCQKLEGQSKEDALKKLVEQKNNDLKINLNTLKEKQKKERNLLIETFKAKFKEIKSQEKVSQFTKMLASAIQIPRSNCNSPDRSSSSTRNNCLLN